MSTNILDNTWIQTQDRAVKAGRILGEVLEKKVQGERPVILVRCVAFYIHSISESTSRFAWELMQNRLDPPWAR